MEYLNLPQKLDQLNYTIYYHAIDKSTSSVDYHQYQSSIKTYLNKLIHQFTGDVGYIWFIQPFDLRTVDVAIQSSADHPILFKGTFPFGECMDEEWFVVYLMNELSKHFLDISITLTDNDGQFLLIESADHLPSWAAPEAADGRVFLKNGHMYLLPPNAPAVPNFPSDIDVYIANDAMMQCIQLKLSQFPNYFSNSIHYCKLKLPTRVANALNYMPQLISGIVRSYYYRDPAHLKGLKAVSGDIAAENEWVDISVKFNRHLFAMVRHQTLSYVQKQYIQSFEHASSSDAHDRVKWELSLKLIIGLELLLNEDTLDLIHPDQSDIRSYPFQKDPEWTLVYTEHLQTNYFQGEIESSTKFQELLNQLKENYLSKLTTNDHFDIMQPSEVRKLLTSSQNPHQLVDHLDDSEDWMEIGVNQLDELFNKQPQFNPDDETMELDDNDDTKLDSIQGKLKTFFNLESDFEGIEPTSSDQTIDLSELESDDYFNQLEFYLNDLTGANEEDAAIEDELREKLTNVDLGALDDAAVEHLVRAAVEETDQPGAGSLLLRQLFENSSAFDR